PSFANRFLSTPPVTDGTSTVTLSVSSSTSVSPGETESPSFFSHRDTVASTMDSPRGGTLIDVMTDAKTGARLPRIYILLCAGTHDLGAWRTGAARSARRRAATGAARGNGRSRAGSRGRAQP